MRLVQAPLLVPGFDTEVYLVLDDLGRNGRVYREADEEKADRESVIRDLLRGQYFHPVRVVAFNSAEGWARDVTEDIAREVKERAERAGDELPFETKGFVEYELS